MLEDFETFCEEFLSCNCCEEHEVATKVAKMSIFLYTRTEVPQDDHDYTGRRVQEFFRLLCIIYEGADREERQIRQDLEREGRPVTPATPIDFSFLRQEFDENALEERHRAGIPRFNRNLGTLSTRERMIIPLGYVLGRTRSFSWWREDPEVYKRKLLEFQLSSVKGNWVAELAWIEPANVNTYLGFILEEKKAARKWYLSEFEPD